MKRREIGRKVGASTETLRKWARAAGADGTIPAPPAPAEPPAWGEAIQPALSQRAPKDPGQGLGAHEEAAILALKKRHPSSCQQKRALLFAEKLREEILAPVTHRHAVFTIPVALRGLFLRERRLLGILPRCAYETVRRCFGAVRRTDKTRKALPGMVAALQSFGSQMQWHPPVHALVSDGLIERGGAFLLNPLRDEDAEELLTETWRRLVLDALVEEERLSPEFRDRLLTWDHQSGFSVHARHLILNAEGEAGYCTATRSPCGWPTWRGTRSVLRSPPTGWGRRRTAA